MKTKFAFFWALAIIPAFSNPAKYEDAILNSEPAPAVNCQDNALAQLKEMPAEPEAIVALVTKAVTEFPSCSCEIVKAVIEKTKAEPKLVGRIVEAAVVAAPEHMRITAQCAIAMAPDALVEVQRVMAALEGNAGEGKSAKSGKEVVSSKDAKGGTPEPAPEPAGKYDNLMNPAYLPIGVPGGMLPVNPPSNVHIPGTTEVDVPLKD